MANTQIVLDQLKTYVLDLIGVDYRDAAEAFAIRAEAAAESAEVGAPDGGWTIPDLADDVHQMLPMSVGVDADGNFDTVAMGGTPLPSFLAAMQTVFGAVSGAMIPFVESEIAELVGAAPETLDTLAEIAEALGGDPNLAANLTAAIGERAKTVDVNTALALKASIAAMHARPVTWYWDGTGTWTPPAAAVATDYVHNLTTGDLHTIGNI